MLNQLGRYVAAFYFVERRGAAYRGSHELYASVARWFRPSASLSEAPDLLPIWTGSFLPFEDAIRRWAFPDVFVVAIGCATAKQRRGLVAHLRARPPLGMFDLDAAADAIVRERPLPLYGFAIPDALIRLNVRGRYVDRDTFLDTIGFQDDDEATAWEIAVEGIIDPPDEDLLGESLLRLLARGAGRKVPGVRAADGFSSLLDHAFELIGARAFTAAGSVAGVAFEQLMRAAADPGWLSQQDQLSPGGHATLNNVIVHVAKRGGWSDTRLHRYRKLRNDLAHRLGDDAGASRTEDELYDEIRQLLFWLDRQSIDESGAALLADVDPEPELSYEELIAEARLAGDEAARDARVTPMKISGHVIEPIGFAWVVVRDARRPFTRWLLDNGYTAESNGGAMFFAPGESLERNLAWAEACADRLRAAGQDAFYAGRPD